MVPTAELLTNYENCRRKGYWASRWQAQRLRPERMMAAALSKALTAPYNESYGDLAGSEFMQLAADRGLETASCRIYDSCLHHAAIADLLATVLRKQGEKAWLIPSKIGQWESSCLMAPDGNALRRIALVSHWTDERKVSECAGWFVAGEIAHYGLPMQLTVAIIGQQRDGKRHTPWSRGYLHPMNRTLRFRKKSRSVSETFNSRWEFITREDHAEISRETWLAGMLRDDVLQDVLLRIDIPVPEARERERIHRMAELKLEALHSLPERPEANLSSCYWPVPCPFSKCCNVTPEREPSERLGFLPCASLSGGEHE